jgi:iron complex outermembrane receptor protein/vitamin B12 transporter
VGATYTLNSSLAFSANWGEGYKLPSFFALGHGLLGNPDLLPETSTGWDLGLAWSATPALRIEASYFYNDFEDLIDFDPENFTNVNRNEVESSGTELQLSWAASEVVSLQAQATYTDLDVKDNASVLLGRPQWKAGTFARWRLSPEWTALLDYQWTGKQLASSLHTGQTVVEELDDYHRVDLALQWRVLPQLQVELALDNLLDEDYQNAVGFHSAGRMLRFGLSLQSSGS